MNPFKDFEQNLGAGLAVILGIMIAIVAVALSPLWVPIYLLGKLARSRYGIDIEKEATD